MNNTLNLFKTAAYRAAVSGPLEVERVERRVVDRYVTVAGKRFDITDLYETLSEVAHNIWITDESYQTLVDIGVLDSLGSSRGYSASEGENFEEFFALVKEAYWRETTR